MSFPHLKANLTRRCSVSNLGGTFPKFFVLKLVDMLTGATCIPPGDKSNIESFSCALESDKHRCKDIGGACKIYRDGYYITNIVCVVVGAVTFTLFIRAAVMKLQKLPMRAWRVFSGSGNTENTR